MGQEFARCRLWEAGFESRGSQLLLRQLRETIPPSFHLTGHSFELRREWNEMKGVKLIFTGGHISLVVAFKGLNVILGLYKSN